MTEQASPSTPAVVRDGSGRFLPGSVPNPGGRPTLPKEVREMLASAAPRAIARLIELVDSDDERVAAACANSVLDRLYGKPVQSVDQKTEVTSIQAAHLRALQDLHERRAANLADAKAAAETVAVTIVSANDTNE